MKIICKICKWALESDDIEKVWTLGKDHFEKNHPEEETDFKAGKKLNRFVVIK